MTRNLGLIVNPIAGLGGQVGLKGTDGVAERALAMGAPPLASARATVALGSIERHVHDLVVWTTSGAMGELISRACHLEPRLLQHVPAPPTSSEDTVRAAIELADQRVDLLLFAGGDGTARDLLSADLPKSLPVLGIPAGVKMHSSVFARSPGAAGRLAAEFLTSERRRVEFAEVMDVDEELLRADTVAPRLHGYITTPRGDGLRQGPKSRSTPVSDREYRGLAATMGAVLESGQSLVVGPGSTLRESARRLGLTTSLSGVDFVSACREVTSDVSESQLLRLTDRESVIVVTPVGGQGYVLGRGNQQISPRLLRRLGRSKVLIVSTEAKLAALRGRPLLVDTPDPVVNAWFSGYVEVVTGARSKAVCLIQSA